MLDRLEAAGFVRREPNPDDRRSVIVTLTDRGDAALAEYREQFRIAIEGAVPSELRSRLAECMGRLSDGLDQLAEAMEAERIAHRPAARPR